MARPGYYASVSLVTLEKLVDTTRAWHLLVGYCQDECEYCDALREAEKCLPRLERDDG